MFVENSAFLEVIRVGQLRKPYAVMEMISLDFLLIILDTHLSVFRNDFRLLTAKNFIFLDILENFERNIPMPELFEMNF